MGVYCAGLQLSAWRTFFLVLCVSLSDNKDTEVQFFHSGHLFDVNPNLKLEIMLQHILSERTLY